MLVSIMMPAYNAAPFIQAAIQSVLDQTYTDWELCIVDDGSTDPTTYIAKRFSDPRIKVWRIPHAGCPTARNACLEMVTGQVIARLDADDLHDPRRITEQVAMLADYDIVSCGYKWLKGGVLLNRRSGGMVPELYMTGKGGSPVCASIVCKTEVYDTVGGFDPNKLAGSDGDWNFRALLFPYTWGYLPKPYYTQRRHGKQLSQDKRNMQRAFHEQSRRKYYPLWINNK